MKKKKTLNAVKSVIKWCFYHFRMYSANFLIFRRISVTRQVLVSLTTMEVNGTRNCLVADSPLNIKKLDSKLVKLNCLTLEGC